MQIPTTTVAAKPLLKSYALEAQTAAALDRQGSLLHGGSKQNKNYFAFFLSVVMRVYLVRLTKYFFFTCTDYNTDFPYRAKKKPKMRAHETCYLHRQLKLSPQVLYAKLSYCKSDSIIVC